AKVDSGGLELVDQVGIFHPHGAEEKRVRRSRGRLGTRRGGRDRARGWLDAWLSLSQFRARLSCFRRERSMRDNSANYFVLLDCRLGYFMPRNIRFELTVGYGDDRHLTNEFLPDP